MYWNECLCFTTLHKIFIINFLNKLLINVHTHQSMILQFYSKRDSSGARKNENQSAENNTVLVSGMLGPLYTHLYLWTELLQMASCLLIHLSGKITHTNTKALLFPWCSTHKKKKTGKINSQKKIYIKQNIHIN